MINCSTVDVTYPHYFCLPISFSARIFGSQPVLLLIDSWLLACWYIICVGSHGPRISCVSGTYCTQPIISAYVILTSAGVFRRSTVVWVIRPRESFYLCNLFSPQPVAWWTHLEDQLDGLISSYRR
ncbi:hypothetical protein BDV30DRAFT_33497 [Aspergillus minisclerotigenes]|uniref:Uncharacterized protein n=1 Tax=Aspergillus minisclerotigenes TaxID=656917 RepID=A0A5N6JFQ0_9EURO|nr:hypothetical protein BDV30DRAFT_33497 [Aspergillus minisclerotigenes]